MGVSSRAPVTHLEPPAGAGGVHRLHADAGQREAGEDVPGGDGRRVPAVLLPPHVVSHLHGQVVRQPPGPAAPGHLAGQPCALPYLPRTVLHSGCVRCALSWPGQGEGVTLGGSGQPCQDPYCCLQAGASYPAVEGHGPLFRKEALR